MDLARWIELLRYPLEIGAFGLAIAPTLIVMQAWPFLPTRIPVGFGATGHPARWGRRALAWILPLLALIVYGYLSGATGTWAWVMDRTARIPDGSEMLLILKPGIALLMMNATEMLTRVARKKEESLNGWLLWGLMALMLAPPLALSFVAH